MNSKLFKTTVRIALTYTISSIKYTLDFFLSSLREHFQLTGPVMSVVFTLAYPNSSNILSFIHSSNLKTKFLKISLLEQKNQNHHQNVNITVSEQDRETEERYSFIQFQGKMEPQRQFLHSCFHIYHSANLNAPFHSCPFLETKYHYAAIKTD